MFKNYALVTFRNILRNKTFTAINVLGLSVSMSVCLVIITMIDDQLGYDKFHSNYEDIYRVIHNRSTGVDLAMATSPLPLGKKIREEFAGVDRLVRFRRGLSGEVLDNGKAIDINGLFTDPDFFELFDFQLARGDEFSALRDPYSVVLKKEIADKFFKDKNPMGELLDIEGLGQFKVTGILEEIPGKTHIEFQALGSFATVPILENQEKISVQQDNWANGSSGWIYFDFTDLQQHEALQQFLDNVTEEYYDESSEYIPTFRIQPMTDITPGPLMGNQIGQSMPNFFVYGLVILAILIMVCAALNYANLTTARALTRFKEVGVRKIMGSTRAQVVLQFVLEAVLISLISLVLAIGLLKLLIPAFERLAISSLLGWELTPNWRVYLQFFLFSVFTGIITGFFPSLYMSSVKALTALKGLSVPKMSKIGLRKSLIVVQLVISIVLIISSSLVYRQIDFMIHRDYGFVKDNIVNIDLQGQDFELLKNELEQLSFVKQVSGANNIPSIGRHDDINIRRLIADDPLEVNYFSVDENYLDNLELTLVAGRNFIPQQKKERELIINETATKTLGFETPEAAIGENVILGDTTEVNIVGVVQDYNFMMLYMDIKPMLLRYDPEDFDWAQVKIAGGDLLNELEQLEGVWTEFDPNHDFECKFFDEHIGEFYSMFYDIVYIVGLVSFLSIVIAGMGLLGIASYTIRTRLKEVSIRKVLGAKTRDILILLGKSFATLIITATLIGGLISFFGNKAWLDLFAYRVSFGLDVVGIAFLFIAVVTGLTIGAQALKAVHTNPSEILRNE